MYKLQFCERWKHRSKPKLRAKWPHESRTRKLFNPEVLQRCHRYSWLTDWTTACAASVYQFISKSPRALSPAGRSDASFIFVLNILIISTQTAKENIVRWEGEAHFNGSLWPTDFLLRYVTSRRHNWDICSIEQRMCVNSLCQSINKKKYKLFVGELFVPLLTQKYKFKFKLMRLSEKSKLKAQNIVCTNTSAI